METNIVKVVLLSNSGQTLGAREYTYFTVDRLKVDDIVVAPIRGRFGKAKVTQVDVPEAEIAAFRAAVKTIPAASLAMLKNLEAGQQVVMPEEMRGVHVSNPHFVDDVADALKKAEDHGSAPLGEPPPPVEDAMVEMQVDLAAGAYHGESAAEAAPATAVIRIGAESDPRVLALYREAQKLLEYAKARTIDSPATQKEATDDLSIIVGVRKRLEEAKREYTAPIREHLERFNAAFKDYTEPLVEADRINREKWTAYDRAVKEAARKAEETNRMAQEVARRQAEQSGTGEFTVETKPVEAPQPVKIVRSAIGTASLRDNWTYEITDFALLPDEYKIENRQALNAFAKSTKGTRQIPGVRIFNDPGMQVRPK